MGPLLYIGGVLTGLMVAAALGRREEEGKPLPGPSWAPSGPPAGMDEVAIASQEFLPAVQQAIRAAKTEPSPTGRWDWKTVAQRLPGLTESVAMFYAMLDPETPTRPKLTIAGAVIYAITPGDLIPDNIPVLGQLDDASILFRAIKKVWGNVTPGHMAQAQEWLTAQGVEPKPIFHIGDPVELQTQPALMGPTVQPSPAFGGL